MSTPYWGQNVESRFQIILPLQGEMVPTCRDQRGLKKLGRDDACSNHPPRSIARLASPVRPTAFAVAAVNRDISEPRDGVAQQAQIALVGRHYHDAVIVFSQRVVRQIYEFIRRLQIHAVIPLGGPEQRGMTA